MEKKSLCVWFRYEDIDASDCVDVTIADERLRTTGSCRWAGWLGAGAGDTERERELDPDLGSEMATSPGWSLGVQHSGPVCPDNNLNNTLTPCSYIDANT